MQTQWSKTTKYLVVAGILISLIWLIFAIQPLIGPLVISALLAYVLNPLVSLIHNRTGIRRNTAVFLVYLLFISVVVAIPSTVTPILVRSMTSFEVDLLLVETQIEAIIAQPVVVGGITLYSGQTAENLGVFFQESIGALSSGALDLLSGITTNLVWVLIIFVSMYYLLRDGPRLTDWFARLMPDQYQEDTRRMLHEINRVWGAFLRGQLILVFVIAITTMIGTGLVGLRGAVALGILAGVLDLIPSLGPLVAGVIAVLVAAFFGSTYLSLSNFWFAVVVAAIFLTIQQIENIWLRPQIMGHSLRLHPALVFIGVLGSLALIGVLGALVIIPVMASIAIVGRYTHARLLGKDPWSAVYEDALQPSEGPVSTPIPASIPTESVQRSDG